MESDSNTTTVTLSDILTLSSEFSKVEVGKKNKIFSTEDSLPQLVTQGLSSSSKESENEPNESFNIFGDTMLFINPFFHGRKYSLEEVPSRQQKHFQQLFHRGTEETIGLKKKIEAGVANENGGSRYFKDTPIEKELFISSNDITEFRSSHTSWNGYFPGTTSVDRYNTELFSKLAITINIDEDFMGIFKLKQRNLSVFILELLNGSIDQYRNIFKNLRITNNFHARSLDIPVEFSLLTMISPRTPITGLLKTNTIECVVLKNGNNIIVTADREFAQNGSQHVIYVNCIGIVKKLQECDSIQIGNNIILRVLKQRNISVLCKIICGGILKARTAVTFPKNYVLDISKATTEEIDDLNFSMEIFVSFVILPTVGDQKYLDSMKATIISLKYRYCKFMATVYLEDLNDMKKAKWIADLYEGVYLIVYKSPPKKKTIIKLNEMAKFLIERCHYLKKPIIMGDFFAESIEESIIVDPDSHKHIFYFCDKFLLKSNQRQPSYMTAYINMNDDHMLTLFEYGLEDLNKPFYDKSTTGSDTFARSVVKTAYNCNASCIILSSVSGRMAIKISNYRPKCPIIVLCDNIQVVRYLSLYHNIWVAFYNHYSKTNVKVLNFKKMWYGILCAISCNGLKDTDKVIYVYRLENNSAFPNKIGVFQANNKLLQNILINV